MSCQDRYTEILNKYWGYTEFRGIQRERIGNFNTVFLGTFTQVSPSRCRHWR